MSTNSYVDAVISCCLSSAVHHACFFTLQFSSNRGIIPQTHIHDRSVSCLGTGIIPQTHIHDRSVSCLGTGIILQTHTHHRSVSCLGIEEETWWSWKIQLTAIIHTTLVRHNIYNNNNNNKLYFKRVTQLVFTNLTWGPHKNIHFVYNMIMTHSMHNITNSY